MAIRYSDINTPTNSMRDFVLRKRTPSMWQLLALFAGTLVVTVIMTMAITDKAMLISVLLVLLGLVGWYVAVQLQRNRDLVLATEFQNALFASALGLNNKFCLIVKNDGNIVYLDRSFQELFPAFIKQPYRTVDALLEHGKVVQEDCEKIYAAIARGIYDKVIFNIRDSGGAFHRVVMSIEPIMRPSGFILLRGREYVEQRVTTESGERTTNIALNKPTITLFSHVMDTMNMGLYMAGPTGNIIYASPMLEEWLDFKDGEIVSSNLLLQDIVYQGGKRAETIEPTNFEGDVMLQKKTGGMIRAFINQKIIHDEQKKPIGCAAMVHNINDQPDVKKKPW